MDTSSSRSSILGCLVARSCRPAAAATTRAARLPATGAGFSQASFSRQISAGSPTLDAVLTPLPFTLVGTVEDADGEAPCFPVVVEVLDGPDAGRVVSPARPQQTEFPVPFQLPNMRPGTFTIRGSSPGNFSGQVTAGSGESRFY
jgi:hypothetical protein